MKSNKTKLLIITNLYPLPWEPNRATFNRQQFDQLEDEYELSYLIPVAFIEWIKNRKSITQTNNKRYFPYFFTPKIGRRLYAVYMFLSMLVHSSLWLKNTKPKKILASWAFPDAVAACWLSKLFNCDFYFKVHGSDIDIQCQNKARAKQVVTMSKHAKGILSVSQDLANKMVKLGIAKDKISVIYNGVDHEKFNQIHAPFNNKDYLLFIGNLKQDKGVMELLNGFAKISNLHPKIELIYAGNGPMLHSLQDKANELEIASKVRFLGNISHNEVPQWLHNCTALALPSYHEGVPNVLLEAMSCGKPIIATRVGGIPEIINQNICGELIDTKSSQAVSDAINNILENTWDKEKIQQHSQQFSWSINKVQLLNFLEIK